MRRKEIPISSKSDSLQLMRSWLVKGAFRQSVAYLAWPLQRSNAANSCAVSDSTNAHSNRAPFPA